MHAYQIALKHKILKKKLAFTAVHVTSGFFIDIKSF